MWFIEMIPEFISFILIAKKAMAIQGEQVRFRWDPQGTRLGWCGGRYRATCNLTARRELVERHLKMHQIYTIQVCKDTGLAEVSAMQPRHMTRHAGSYDMNAPVTMSICETCIKAHLMAREGPSATPTVSTFIVTNSLKKEAPSIAAAVPPPTSSSGAVRVSCAELCTDCFQLLVAIEFLPCFGAHSCLAMIWCSSHCGVRCSITGLARSCSWGSFVQELPAHIRQLQKWSNHINTLEIKDNIEI